MYPPKSGMRPFHSDGESFGECLDNGFQGIGGGSFGYPFLLAIAQGEGDHDQRVCIRTQDVDFVVFNVQGEGVEREKSIELEAEYPELKAFFQTKKLLPNSSCKRKHLSLLIN